MDLKSMPYINSKPDVYTDLQGLQDIKNASRDEGIQKVSQQFEALFVNMMMKNMRSANKVFEEGSLFDSEESRFYRDMLDQQRALTLSQGRGIGIADAMYRQLTRSHSDVRTDELVPPDMSRISNKKQSDASISETAITKPSEDRKAFEFDSPENFVEKLMPLAEKAAEKLGIDHLLMMAQSALETGWGKHVIANTNTGESSHNLFNIKSGGQWSKDSVAHATLEFEKGKFSKEVAQFRSYPSFEESFDDYVDFVQGSGRYQSALEKATNPESFIRELHKAGYATDPEYSEKVLSVYEKIKQIVSESDSTRQGGLES